MAKGKAKAPNTEARRIEGSRPEHTPTPLPLRTNGVVSNVNITVCGEQHGRITTIAPGTGTPVLQIEFTGVTMQFTNCEQVQLTLGLFAIARQARMGMARMHQLPGIMSESNVGVQTTMMWTRPPNGAAHRDQFTHPVTRKVSPYVTLRMPPLTFALMDTTAIETMLATMKKAHKLAIALFDDGDTYAKNSAADSWRPRAQHRFKITGTGWITNGPTPGNGNR